MCAHLLRQEHSPAGEGTTGVQWGMWCELCLLQSFPFHFRKTSPWSVWVREVGQWSEWSTAPLLIYSCQGALENPTSLEFMEGAKRLTLG